MATYYCGPNGNDGNNGSTWALRKATLNGCEDIPVVAADVVYVGPGVYREQLTVDVSGNAGNPITYIGDCTGEHTDGIGGVVRITGSDTDQTAARAYCVTSGNYNYRTFRGFTMDTGSSHLIYGNSVGTNWVIEDCVLYPSASSIAGIYMSGANHANSTIRRCIVIAAHRFVPGSIWFTDSSARDDLGHAVENCIILGSPSGYGIRIEKVGGISIKNCAILNSAYGINVSGLNVGQTATVTNCVIQACNYALYATAVGEITEDYNTIFGEGTARTNTSVGANSVTYPAILQSPILHSGASQVSGFRFPVPMLGELSEWSQVKHILGADERTVDLFGVPRPALDTHNSWGAFQYVDRELESGTVQAGSYGRVIHSPGQTLVRRIPVTNTEITVTLYMRYSANYEGDLPRMVIRQPGQADTTDTMTAAADTWEQLSCTFTPAALPRYIEVWAESRHVPTTVDSEQGNLSYTTDGAEQTFTDDAQDFSDYDTDPTVSNALASHFILVTNDDGTTSMGWLREVGGGGNTEITVANEVRLNDNGTLAPAMWIGQYSAKTPVSYDVFETADVYYDTLAVA